MEASVFESTLKVYHEAFAEEDKAKRIALLQRCMTPDAEIWGPQRLLKGYEAISEKIEGFHKRMRGARLLLASGLNVFESVARFRGAILNGDGTVRTEGEAVVLLAEDGRISKVFPFWEPVPPLPAT
jgi:hypothetical protein